jgi:primary-amine oxidase
MEPLPVGDENPLDTAFAANEILLESEKAAERETSAATSRYWRIKSTEATNRLGKPTGYCLLPGSTPTIFSAPDSPHGRRAGFARHNLWVTPTNQNERWAAGRFPTQRNAGMGLPEWTAADRPITSTDVTVWHTFGLTHDARMEDWPVMPVEYAGFLLVPDGFFDRNPALDVPELGLCH